MWMKGGGDAVKYVKQPKRHIVLDDFEWRALVKGINEYRKQVIDEIRTKNGNLEVALLPYTETQSQL